MLTPTDEVVMIQRVQRAHIEGLNTFPVKERFVEPKLRRACQLIEADTPLHDSCLQLVGKAVYP